MSKKKRGKRGKPGPPGPPGPPGVTGPAARPNVEELAAHAESIAQLRQQVGVLGKLLSSTGTFMGRVDSMEAKISRLERSVAMVVAAQEPPLEGRPDVRAISGRLADLEAEIRDTKAPSRPVEPEPQQVTREAVEALFRDYLPPYLFPTGEKYRLPGMEKTTVNDAIRDVWRSAKEQVLALFDEPAPGLRTDTKREAAEPPLPPEESPYTMETEPRGFGFVRSRRPKD